MTKLEIRIKHEARSTKHECSNSRGSDSIRDFRSSKSKCLPVPVANAETQGIGAAAKPERIIDPSSIRMHRYWAVFAAGLVTCVLPGPAWAEDGARSVLACAAVAPQPDGKSPGVLLKRGDAVTPVGKIDCELGGVTAIRFGPENQHQARVPTWLLSTKKPPPEAAGAADKPQGDLQRLNGTWGVVARSMLGTLNPGLKDKLNARPAAEYWFSRNAGPWLGRRQSHHPRIRRCGCGCLQSGFEFDGCIFTDKETAFWRMSASDCDRPLEQSQNYHGTYNFTSTRPRRPNGSIFCRAPTPIATAGDLRVRW